ncbi:MULTISPECIES: gluconokinase [Prauserella salsuginis group]|uniref:Gluconokinase n=2 Tax=Prauserella salsuginis group TaxID=2893672 RepID=A0A839XQH7_9PSEU|nr:MULTISPECIES: gluconokinase [Prauserella salsuginis group]MBB3664937.1 gluconokinase [Prauserella sediminis]MCR3718407.1 gluconokinase [Prauserella flava]MCR3732977.1 gluconokinase [Prauserella salsuginis]
MPATCLVVMGVSGAGKSTIAAHLADELGWPMAEADEFHPEANIAKMSAGTPLTDADRIPWLEALRAWIDERGADGESVVVTCSALKRTYRDVLRRAGVRVRFVHLSGSVDTVGGRLSGRSGHFMPPALLESQFADLEPLDADEDGVALDVSDAPDSITATALDRLGLRSGGRGDAPADTNAPG